jgi:hypothetical protein
VKIRYCCFTDGMLILFLFARLKVDLTKYIEQHQFTFDDVFDADSTNDYVNIQKKGVEKKKHHFLFL